MLSEEINKFLSFAMDIIFMIFIEFYSLWVINK